VGISPRRAVDAHYHPHRPVPEGRAPASSSFSEDFSETPPIARMATMLGARLQSSRFPRFFNELAPACTVLAYDNRGPAAGNSTNREPSPRSIRRAPCGHRHLHPTGRLQSATRRVRGLHRRASRVSPARFEPARSAPPRALISAQTYLPQALASLGPAATTRSARAKDTPRELMIVWGRQRSTRRRRGRAKIKARSATRRRISRGTNSRCPPFSLGRRPTLLPLARAHLVLDGRRALHAARITHSSSSRRSGFDGLESDRLLTMRSYSRLCRPRPPSRAR